jgi:hypothetical protein
VPTDTLLWGFPASSARLIRPSGEEVPLDERMFEVTGPAVIDGKPVTVPVLVPHAELERNAAYAIEVDYGTDAVHLREFSTGAGPTRELPAPPVLVSSEPRMSAGWQGWGGGPPERWLELQFEYDHILIGDAGGLGPFASIDDLFIDPAAAQKASSERERLTWITSADGLSVGRGGCISWPEGAPDIQSASVRSTWPATSPAGSRCRSSCPRKRRRGPYWLWSQRESPRASPGWTRAPAPAAWRRQCRVAPAFSRCSRSASGGR